MNEGNEGAYGSCGITLAMRWLGGSELPGQHVPGVAGHGSMSMVLRHTHLLLRNEQAAWLLGRVQLC